jgi:hypothetical protein
MQSSPSGSGRLVKVAYAPTQMEAEMIQGLLREHPDFLGAGPHQVFVAEAVAEEAREVLKNTPGEG